MASEYEEDEPPRKRAKASKIDKGHVESTNNRRLFAPFRALGFITNHVPFAMQVRSYKGATGAPRIHILSCIGKAWIEFEGERMKVLFVGPEEDFQITSMTMEGNNIWVTAGPSVICYEAGRQISRFINPFHTILSSIIAFGSQILALTDDGRRLLTWDAQSGELLSTITFDEDFTATQVIHPATLLNKVLVSSAQGSMQLWNIRTNVCIYTFSPDKLHNAHSKPTKITTLVQSNVADLVGIGFASGFVSIHDIRSDEQLLSVRMDGGAIKSIAFRTDGQEILATANSTGNIALWNLNEKGRILHIIRGAHDSSISCIQWVPGHPLLFSSGDDNSIKQWIFDGPDLPPRLLKYRSGHHSPPNLIRYYGEDGKQILTTGQDRSLRCTSVVRDSRSFELSQGPLSKKATSLSLPLASLKIPPATSISFSTARSSDWDDVLTAHADESFARTWSVTNKRLGKFSFSTAKDTAKSSQDSQLTSRGVIRAVHVTACGNFGLAASSNGIIQVWSMQSGLKRKVFELGPAPEEVDSRFRIAIGSSMKGGKGRCVTGLAVDALNKALVVGTLDGTLNFFNFHSKLLEETLVLPTSVVALNLQRANNLLAVICDDLVLRLFDLETKRLVRELTGFKGRILDVTFSHDSRWIFTTSLDSIIRTFDIPTGQLIDAFRTSSTATSISFSPTGDFLATSHVDSAGIYLWANRAQYAEVSWRSAAEVEAEAYESTALPTVQGTREDEALDGLTALGVIESSDVFRKPPEMDGELITLTLLPRARWQTLLNLDVIMERNRPKEAAKAPEKAPFFLPSLPGESLRLDVEAKVGIEEGHTSTQKMSSRLEKNRAMETESEFQRLLRGEPHDGQYDELFKLLKILTPAAVDLELRLLITLQQQALFLRALTQRLCSHNDFEMVQTLMAVFLKLHGESLIDNVEMQGNLERLLQASRAENEKIGALINKGLGVLNFIRDVE
ncbi:hypothetical protein FRC20_011092 [Serendipita sp. 405]|nr:hypothetical protein FRC20_011092 [Serendipita sp. 405]